MTDLLAIARRRLVPTEKDVQRQVVALYRLAGCHVYNLSQSRATRQTEGIPDLFVVWPERGVAWWHEVKRPGGKLRPEQATFRDECHATGVRHVVGGVDDAVAMLNSIRRTARP